MDTLDILLPDGTTTAVPVLHLSPNGTFAAVKLAGTAHKGTVDVFHVATGKRATPTRLFDKVRTQKIAKALADALDEYDPVTPDGQLLVPRGEYHERYDGLVAASA